MFKVCQTASFRLKIELCGHRGKLAVSIKLRTLFLHGGGSIMPWGFLLWAETENWSGLNEKMGDIRYRPILDENFRVPVDP